MSNWRNLHRLWPTLLFVLLSLPCLAAEPASPQRAELIGIAKLPSDVFVPGPVSGQFIDTEGNPALSLILPFSAGQPLQGFSAILPDQEGTFLVLADNGFGTKANSPDFLLSLYRIRPDFKTADGGSGTLDIESSIRLRDPFEHTPFTRVADSAQQVTGAGLLVTVDESIRQRSLLTGADFDPESLQLGADGGYWIGDEFGPWLLHFDVVGRLLHAPFAIPGLSSPDNPQAGTTDIKTVRSGGFEGMAYDASQQKLYVMLEKPLAGSSRQLPVYVFDIPSETFSTQPVLMYPLDESASAVGSFQYLGQGAFIALERDSEQSAAARVKRIYRVLIDRVDEHGVLQKTLLADLLDIADPNGLSAESRDGTYSFSYLTSESLVVLGNDTLGVLNDNNYPFGSGPGGSEADAPEATVFIKIRVRGLERTAPGSSIQ